MGVEYSCCTSGFFSRIGIVVFLVLFAGMMSGLTLGLMSMSLVEIEVLAKSGKPSDRKHAAKILPVVRRQHLLLCTLLICNAAAMEALPIFLDSLVTAWGAILISVTLILLFGEIIPQAVCSRYGLAIGAAVAPFVRLLVWICFPVAYPISKLLDFSLGKEHKALFRRAELKTLVDFHGNEAGKGGELTRDETTIIGGALELTEKVARDVMTPLSETFAIDVNANLDSNLIKLILEKGHSRVPVFYEHPANIIGLVLVKNLITGHSPDGVPIKNFPIRKCPRVSETMPLYDILNDFQKGHSHMAVVVREKENPEKPISGNQLEGKHLPSSFLFNLVDDTYNTNAHAARDVKVDIDGENHPQEKSLKSKRSLKRLNTFVDRSNYHRKFSGSKKWSKDFDSEVLHIADDMLAKLTEEGEAIGIITLEDVIEELLQEEIYDETDYRT
ncbi:DUF21 domain-containing protein At2g14520-like isoform X1 [Cucurbita moschata]|uniref:DUF21 domain-containing protein At2g14520-like isoform X1 n=1 Tax=Cucurbita moschata TaxID=3662 RepID=A0A6J1HJD9_CUCMO|nr:DUF21 domain-containing protein At2g14520-like isoform X1 [Cucurbita moschata]